MCKTYAIEYPDCKCVLHYKAPDQCGPYVTSRQKIGYDYEFVPTLCPVLAPYRNADCCVTTTGPGKPEELAIVGVDQDEHRRPYRMICDTVECVKTPWSQEACPLHDDLFPTVPDRGDLLTIPWLSLDIIGHAITLDQVSYWKWERNEKGGTKTLVTLDEVDADKRLTERVNWYHDKKKGPGETPWPWREEPSWLARLNSLRSDPSKRHLKP